MKNVKTWSDAVAYLARADVEPDFDYPEDTASESNDPTDGEVGAADYRDRIEKLRARLREANLIVRALIHKSAPDPQEQQSQALRLVQQVSNTLDAQPDPYRYAISHYGTQFYEGLPPHLADPLSTYLVQRFGQQSIPAWATQSV